MSEHDPLHRELAITRQALTLAVNMLSHYEPPDARAFSDEFVALAMISDRQLEPGAIAIVVAALNRLNAR